MRASYNAELLLVIEAHSYEEAEDVADLVAVAAEHVSSDLKDASIVEASVEAIALKRGRQTAETD